MTPEPIDHLSHSLVQKVFELGRACGVSFYSIPRTTTREEAKAAWGASPCPIPFIEMEAPIPLFCKMADTSEGTPGALYISEGVTLDEWEFNWCPYYGAVVLLHELAHAVVGDDERLTVPWEQSACLELFGDDPEGQSLMDNMVMYGDGAALYSDERAAEVQLREAGVLDDQGKITRRIYQGPGSRSPKMR